MLTIRDILKQEDLNLDLFTEQQIQKIQSSFRYEAKGDKTFLTCCNKDIQIHSSKKSNPEEIIRQLYLLKLTEE